MASKASISKNYKKQSLAYSSSKKKLLYRTLKYDQSLPADFSFQLSLRMAQLPRNSHSTRAQNRCIVTGRRHGIYRKFKISRIKLKEFVSSGTLPGVRKSSW